MPIICHSIIIFTGCGCPNELQVSISELQMLIGVLIKFLRFSMITKKEKSSHIKILKLLSDHHVYKIGKANIYYYKQSNLCFSIDILLVLLLYSLTKHCTSINSLEPWQQINVLSCGKRKRNVVNQLILLRWRYRII